MNKKAGFTLIEILIALAVFAILATATSSIMYYAFNTRARVNQQADRLNMVQLALLLIERDTTQTIPRSIFGNEMHLFPAFIGQSQYFELTRLGFENPHSIEKRSNLQRVAYICNNNQLLRRIWPTLDSTNRDRFEDRIVLDNLVACRFAYLNHNLQVLPEWRGNAVQQNQKPEPLPKAIQINLTLKDWDKTSLLFIIPEALYAEQ